MDLRHRHGTRELASLFGIGTGEVPVSGSVPFVWRKPGMFARTYDLLGPDDTLVGVAERNSVWSMTNEMRFALPNGERLNLRSEGGVFTKEYHVTNSRGDWLASWQRTWARRVARLGPYELRPVRAGIFSPWWQLETADGTVVMRWRERWRGFSRDLEVTAYPNELPDLKPNDWLTMTLLALHISLDQYRSRSS